jgi:pimeloyl-ACP methyl ester carboxylesterase
MPIFENNNYEVYYEFTGDKNAPVIVFVNGLTQRVMHWKVYQEYFNKIGYGVLLFDMMEQGQSLKPALFIDFQSNEKSIALLLDYLKIKKAYIAGISFGGVVVLRFAIDYPGYVKGIIPISTFSEMDDKLFLIGSNLYEGMTQIGFEYLVKLFSMWNFSNEYLHKMGEKFEVVIRDSFANNDVYAIQNLMESLLRFRNFTHELNKIKAPTLILNGEYDSLTPREYHEKLRINIKNSKLILMQHVCHAFTIEIPEITTRIIKDFIEQVEQGSWKGDQSVLIATDDPKSETLFYPCEGDHTRCIPVFKKPVTSEKSDTREDINLKNEKKAVKKRKVK